MTTIKRGLYPVYRVSAIPGIKLVTVPVGGRWKYEFQGTRVVFDSRWLVVISSPVVTDVGGVPTFTLDWPFGARTQPRPI